jgi:deoxyhypusine synthase
MKSGIEYMAWLADWYVKNSEGKGVGFFQIGGGIAGDFPICVVPMLYQDMEMQDIPFWSYFLPDLRFDHLVRVVLGRGAERENNLGKTGYYIRQSLLWRADATIVAPLNICLDIRTIALICKNIRD